jgi:hypothetical protein
MRVPRRLHPPINFVAQPTNHSPHGFGIQTKKPSQWFWAPNHQIIAAGFDSQTRKPVATGFEVKPGETVDLGFEAKPRNLRSSSPCAQCRPHTVSSDLSIIRPPSARHVLDHSQSSVPGLLLLPRSSSLPVMPHLSPTHHEISKRNSPAKIDSTVQPSKFHGFKFKLRQVNYSSQSNQGTDHLVSQKSTQCNPQERGTSWSHMSNLFNYIMEGRVCGRKSSVHEA